MGQKAQDFNNAPWEHYFAHLFNLQKQRPCVPEKTVTRLTTTWIIRRKSNSNEGGIDVGDGHHLPGT